MNAREILRALQLLTSGVVEVRMLGTAQGTVSGYYDGSSLELVAQHLRRWDAAPGIYVTLNPVRPECLARSANTLTTRARTTTGDGDILCRRWLPIDLDPVRVSGISSSDVERQLAFSRGTAILEWLMRRGWGLPILADSGNGIHLLYRVELPADDGGLVKRVLEALAFTFDDAAVKVDVSVHNPARIWKLYGTMARKGSSTQDRPHREARILKAPELQVITVEQLETLALAPPKVEKTSRPLAGPFEAFDIHGFVARHLQVATESPWQGGTKWILAVCPWNEQHTDRSAWVAQFPSGAIAAGCHHNGCQGRRWADLREMLEPRVVVPLRRGPIPVQAPPPAPRVEARQAQPPLQAQPLHGQAPAPAHHGRPARYLEDTFLEALPPVVWANDIIAEYVRRVGRCTEAPDTFHLMGYLGAIGAGLGRSLWKVQGRRIFPNLYVALIGDSGRGRKSTALHYALRFLEAVDPGPQVIKSVGSAEALLERLAEAEMTDDEREKFRERHIACDALHRRAILVYDEISSFLQKSHRDSTGGLIQQVVEAFDCPEQLDHSTRRQKLVANVPTLSFLGCSNAFWLEKFTTLGEVLGGFSNRFLYVDGERKPPMPDPPALPGMGDLVEAVHGILAHYISEPRELPFTAAAAELWASWYSECYYLPTHTESTAILFQRAQVNAVKLALIYAAHDLAEAIDVRHLEAGIAIALYSGRVVAASLADVADNDFSRLEAKVIGFLRAKGPETARLIKKGIRGANMTQVLACLQALEAGREVVAEECGRTVQYRLVTDEEEAAKKAAEVTR